MRAEIFWLDRTPAAAGRLAVLPRPRGGDWLEDEVRSLRAAGVDTLVCLLTKEEVTELDLADEAACCAAAGRGRPVPDPPEQRDWVLRFAERHLLARPDRTTLLLSTREMPGTEALADAALAAGWSVRTWQDGSPAADGGRVVYYGRTDVA